MGKFPRVATGLWAAWTLPLGALRAEQTPGWSPIPDARIAVSALHGPIRLSTLAGFPERVIVVGNVNAQDWSPGGDRLVYVDDRGGGEYALSVTDTLGATTPLPVPLRSTWPQYSHDGRWIYFFVQDGSPEVHRVAPDGSGLERLMSGSFPSPAPDGMRVAVTVATGLWVGDAITRIGAVVPNTSGDAVATRWSPDGAWIAYRDRRVGGITLIRPDGTGKRVIPAPPVGGLAWSPSAAWLLAGNVDGEPLQLVDVRAATVRELPVSGVYPAWRPERPRIVALRHRTAR